MAERFLPTPHLDKLAATLKNPKLPKCDRGPIESAVSRYQQWVADLRSVPHGPSSVGTMVGLLNDYRRFLDLEVIFDSNEDFLYRQKGQTKLDNSVIEEFLPHLVETCILDDLEDDTLQLGPQKAFSGVYFTSSLALPKIGGGLHVRKKDQDFLLSRRIYLKSSYSDSFERSQDEHFHLAYVAAECKTNLDKTMFQEASATARDVKSSLLGAKYFLMCEWLDMTPQSTAAAGIDEVLILRKGKRMNSNIRSMFGSVSDRKKTRSQYIDFIDLHPFYSSVFERFISQVSQLLHPEDPTELNALKDGYF